MASTTALLTSLKSASLLPSPIIPADFTPSYDVTITFPSLTPSNGALARVSQVASQPHISISALSSSAPDPPPTFTLMQIDPDAPTPADPKFGYWRHWIVSGIPFPSPTTPEANVVEKGRTVTTYLAPGPKDESGPHRYLFLLFRESAGGLEREDVGGEEFVDRRSFRAEAVVKEKGLELVGVQWMRGVGDGWVEGKGEL